VVTIALIALASVFATGQPGGEVRGRVLDGRSGESIGRVAVQLTATPYRAETSAEGEFRIAGVAAGDYTLTVSTVGYHLVKKTFSLAEGEVKEFEVALAASTLRQTDTVEVRAGPFERERAESPSMLTLEGVEAKNLASVLADDPLRAVQGMPGVASNNDFASQFSVRGADYSRIGLYIDDLLVHAPFHQVQGEFSGSMTILNGDAIDSIALHAGAWPARFADRSAGVLDVKTREGDRERLRFRASASASNAGALAEGPLGRERSQELSAVPHPADFRRPQPRVRFHRWPGTVELRPDEKAQRQSECHGREIRARPH